MARSARPTTAAKALREKALAYPEVREDFPWGHSAFKVRGKAFVFMSAGKGSLGITMKLPRSSVAAHDLPFAEPSRHGLGKSGWVTSRFEKGDAVPLDLLDEWMEESYRAVAPKRLSKRLHEELRASSSRGRRAAKKRTTSPARKETAARDRREGR